MARREAFFQKYGLPVTDDLDAIMADRSIDAVLILIPPASRLDRTRRSHRRRRWRRGVKLGVVLQNRFGQRALHWQKLLNEGRLGRLIGASARIDNWRPQSYYNELGRARASAMAAAC